MASIQPALLQTPHATPWPTRGQLFLRQSRQALRINRSAPGWRSRSLPLTGAQYRAPWM